MIRIKMLVLIIRSKQGWDLRIKNNGRVTNSWSFKRLIDAYDMANTLQLHVDNMEALPIKQRY